MPSAVRARDARGSKVLQDEPARLVLSFTEPARLVSSFDDSETLNPRPGRHDHALEFKPCCDLHGSRRPRVGNMWHHLAEHGPCNGAYSRRPQRRTHLMSVAASRLGECWARAPAGARLLLYMPKTCSLTCAGQCGRCETKTGYRSVSRQGTDL